MKDDRSTLAEAGIDKALANRVRKLAAVPEDKFNAMVGEWRERVGSEATSCRDRDVQTFHEA